MSEVQQKWKTISQPKSRMNRMISRTKDLPDHFGPMKIRSESVANQTLNLERSQVYSNSIERSVLNITREDDSVEKNKKQSRGGKIRFEQDI